MKIIVRRAGNDHEALVVAQSMENAGAIVFSVTHNGMHKPYGAMDPSSKFVVWAKVETDAQIAAIDEAIDEALDLPLR